MDINMSQQMGIIPNFPKGHQCLEKVSGIIPSLARPVKTTCCLIFRHRDTCLLSEIVYYSIFRTINMIIYTMNN